MDKRSYFVNNSTSENVRITELNLSIPPGISNLFELNSNLSYEQIDYSMRNGTFRAAIENGLCYPVPELANQKSFSDDIQLRKPSQVQVFPSRARFTAVQNGSETTVFDPQEDANLFGDEVKPARLVEEEMKKAASNVEAIEATIKQANLPEKPVENRYVPPPVQTTQTQEKLKNDLTMGYETCEGTTAGGKRCMRRAKTGKKYCGLHSKQAK